MAIAAAVRADSSAFPASVVLDFLGRNPLALLSKGCRVLVPSPPLMRDDLVEAACAIAVPEDSEDEADNGISFGVSHATSSDDPDPPVVAEAKPPQVSDWPAWLQTLVVEWEATFLGRTGIDMVLNRGQRSKR